MANTAVTEFINSARARRCSIAHIEGRHGSGKSTKTIAEIWSVVADDPDMTMIYMQPTEAQTALLGDFFTASGDAKVTAGLSDKRLKLWSFATATHKMLNPSEKLGLKVVMCIDLEVVQTAYGEFLLACLLELAIQAHESDLGTRYVLVTVGSGPHRYPAFDPFSAPTIINPDRTIQAPGVQGEFMHDELDLAPMARRILVALGPEAPGGDGGIALLFLSPDDFDAFYSSQPIRGCEIPTIRITARSLNDVPSVRIRGQTSIQGPAFVHITGSVPVTLPFRNVRAVVSSYSNRVCVLDGQTGLYAHKDMAVSAGQLRVQGAHATSMISILCLGVTEPDPPNEPESLAFGAELLLLGLLAFRKWPHLPADQMPLAKLSVCDKYKWVEAIGRLQAMGMVSPNQVASKPQQLTAVGGNAVGWLAHVDNWRVACFLARIKERMPALEKRVYIRLAAIIALEVPLTVARMSRRIMREMRDTATGPAPSMVFFGQIWVALSLWERCRRMDNFAEMDRDTPFAVGEVTLYDAVGIHKEVLRLEAVLNLPAETEEERGGKLNEQQLLFVQQALVSAWLTNMIWIPKRWSQTQPDIRLARCFAYDDQIEIDEETEVIFLGAIQLENGLHALALDIIQGSEPHSAKAFNLLIVDSRAVGVVADRMGITDIRQALRSLYADRGRA